LSKTNGMSLLVMALLFNMNIMKEKPVLIYVGDPMCSWCYGISEELTKTIAYFEDRVEVELVLGGLRAGGGDQWDTSFKDFLRHHWEDVSKASGQPFSYQLLELESFNYDTEPSCRAVVTVEQMAKEKAFPFFKAVQKGFYLKNEDPTQTEFYQPICEALDIDFAKFAAKFESTEMREITKGHFERSAALGARSFPTVLLLQGGKLTTIAVGYSTFDQMKAKIEANL